MQYPCTTMTWYTRESLQRSRWTTRPLVAYAAYSQTPVLSSSSLVFSLEAACTPPGAQSDHSYLRRHYARRVTFEHHSNALKATIDGLANLTKLLSGISSDKTSLRRCAPGTTESSKGRLTQSRSASSHSLPLQKLSRIP